MKKYQWENTILQKKFRLYNRISLGFGVLALLVSLLFQDASVWWFALLLIGVVACIVLSGRIQNKDKQLKLQEKIG